MKFQVMLTCVEAELLFKQKRKRKLNHRMTDKTSKRFIENKLKTNIASAWVPLLKCNTEISTTSINKRSQWFNSEN